MKKFLLPILLIAAFVLSACGAPAVTPEVGEAGAAGGEKVTLRFWSHSDAGFSAAYDALVKAYTDEHPNVEITHELFDYELYIQTLQTAMPAGQEADIISLFGTWTSQYYERLAPVPADVLAMEEAEKIFYEAPLGGFTVDGKLYGIPQEFNLEYGGALVNKTMFEAAGLAYPPQWKTMDDVVADGVKLSQTDDTGMMTVAGFQFDCADPTGFSFLAGIKQRGGDYWNADRTGFTFNTPEAKAQLQWMVDAVNQGVVDPVLFNDESNFVIDAFFTNKTAIGYIGSWAIGEGRASYPDFADEWDYLFMPSIQGDPVFVADSGWGLVVSPNSKHQDIAWDFIKFVTLNQENAASWNMATGTIPALIEVSKSPVVDEKEPWVAKALDILPHGEYLGNMPDRDLVMYEILYPHILEALQGVKTVDEALEAIDSEANSTFK